MSDSLRDKLARLARTDEEWTVTGRVLTPADATPVETVLQALLDEIDDTVLTAQLVFGYGGEGPGSGRLTLLAGGRRLRGVVAATDGLTPGDLPGRPLDTDADLGALAHLLGGFAAAVQASAAPLTVIATPAPGQMLDGLPEAGVPVARLTGALDLGADDQDAPLPARLLTRLGDDVLSHVMQDAEGADSTGGDADLTETLRALIGDGAGEIRLTCWLPARDPAPDAPVLARVVTPADGRLALAVSPANIAKLQTVWARLTRKS